MPQQRSVCGEDRIGGFVSVGFGGNEKQCFWDIETSGVADSGGGVGLPTAEMWARETYLEAGWDFSGEQDNGLEDTWVVSWEEADYPKLAWE